MTVPLDQPHFGIGPAGMLRFVRKYATFRGRASRSEFWWGQLTLAIAWAVLSAPGWVLVVLGWQRAERDIAADPALVAATPLVILDRATPGLGLLGLAALLMLGLAVPGMALTWRRLQDAGVPGGWAFAFVLGGGALAGVTVASGLAPLVPGLLASSAKGARFERSATPILGPGVSPAAWAAEAAAAQHRAHGWQPHQQHGPHAAQPGWQPRG